MNEERKDKLKRFRKWLVVQRFTLLRGYGWGQVPMLGVIFASTIKAAFPGFIGNLRDYILLIIFSFIALYIAGYVDSKLKLLHEEQQYATETNPLMMAGLRGELKNETK